jgi:AbrB family looped-hinge helix DNA binding protein
MSKKETFKQAIIDDGRITIPALTRKILGLQTGDIILVTVQKEEA